MNWLPICAGLRLQPTRLNHWEKLSCIIYIKYYAFSWREGVRIYLACMSTPLQCYKTHRPIYTCTFSYRLVAVFVNSEISDTSRAVRGTHLHNISGHSGVEIQHGGAGETANTRMMNWGGVSEAIRWFAAATGDSTYKGDFCNQHRRNPRCHVVHFLLALLSLC